MIAGQHHTPHAFLRLLWRGRKHYSAGVACLLAVTLSFLTNAPNVWGAQATADQDTSPQQNPIQLTPSDQQDPYAFYASQIDNEEARSAQQSLEDLISVLEGRHGRFSNILVKPLTLLGDAQFKQNQLTLALDSYDQAIHLARLNNGLFSSEQVDIVRRQAEAYAAIGDPTNAVSREEYAFRVVMREADDKANLQQVIEAYGRLASRHLEYLNHMAAREVYSQALQFLAANGLANSLHAIEFLEGIADTYKAERFPPKLITTTTEDTSIPPIIRQVGATANVDITNQYATINSYPAGERALKRAVQLRQTIATRSSRTSDLDQYYADLVQLNGTILKLADWFILFGQARDATTMYRQIVINQAALPDGYPSIDLETPTLLYFPRPRDQRPPSLNDRLAAENGAVTLGFDVSTTGRVRSLKTLEAVPDQKMVFNVRRCMREAVFRPVLSDNQLQHADEQTFTYTYQYYPSRKAQQKQRAAEEAAKAQAAPDTSSIEPAASGEAWRQSEHLNNKAG